MTPSIKVMLKACLCGCQQCWARWGGHPGTPFPGRVCGDVGQPLTHPYSALAGGEQGKFEPFYFPAKAQLVLTPPILPLGAAILPSLDLKVIPINMYENFMIKRGISPFIFQTCPNTHHPAPKPRAARQGLMLGSPPLRMHTPKRAGSLQGQAHPPGHNCTTWVQHFFLSPFPLRINN